MNKFILLLLLVILIAEIEISKQVNIVFWEIDHLINTIENVQKRVDILQKTR